MEGYNGRIQKTLQRYCSMKGNVEVKAFFLRQQWESPFYLPLECRPVVGFARFDDDLEIFGIGESASKILVDLFPTTPILQLH